MMAHWTVAVCLSAVLFIAHQVTCDWTFSLRVDSGRCCPSVSPCMQEQMGSCEDLYIGLCLRTPDTPLMDRGSCPVLFSANGSDIVDRELTPADGMFFGSITTTGYQGGIQIYAGVTLVPDIPPFDDGVDEILVTAEPTPGGGEVSVTGKGENQRASLIFLISVDCSPGYGGDDCLTLNTCSDQITCNQTLGYCNTAGECVCYDGTTQCVNPPASSSPATSERDPVPIIAGVVVAVVMLAIILIIIVVLIIVLVRRKNEKKKAAEEIVLTGHLVSSPASTLDPPTPEIPLYSTINKEKKRRRSPPEVPAPYQVPVTEADEENVTTRSIDQVAESHEEEDMTNGTAVRNSKGLMYAQLDIHSKKEAPPKPPRSLETSPPPPSQGVTYSTVNPNPNPYSKPRTPSQPASDEEVAYYSVAN